MQLPESIVANREMREVFALAEAASRRRATLSNASLRAIAQGFTARDGLLVLPATQPVPRRRLWRRPRPEPVAPEDTYGWEWTENSLFLASTFPARLPEWRFDVLAQAEEIVASLLPKALAVSPHPVQAQVLLQSGPDSVDPDIDFPVGKVKFYQLRAGADPRDRAEQWEQPVAFYTDGLDRAPLPALPSDDAEDGWGGLVSKTLWMENG